jgi:hypothetical protein
MKETQITIAKNLILKVMTYKVKVSMFIAGLGAVLTSLVQWMLDTSFLGVTVIFILLTCSLIIIDFWYGNRASAKKPDYKGVESVKITYTLLKFGMFFVWLFLVYSIKHEMKNIEWFTYILSAITAFPVFLVNLREFVSIGENIESIYGKKPYIFTLIDKVFTGLEKTFLGKVNSIPEEVGENNK